MTTLESGKIWWHDHTAIKQVFVLNVTHSDDVDCPNRGNRTDYTLPISKGVVEIPTLWCPLCLSEMQYVGHEIREL